MNNGSFRVPLALFGYAVIFTNLGVALIPGAFSSLWHSLHTSTVSGGITVILITILWLTIASTVFLPLIPTIGEGSSSEPRRRALMRLASAFAIGWPLAWICLMPHEKSGFGGDSALVYLILLAGNFAGAICLAQGMPKFRVRFHVPVRFSAI